MKRIQLSLISHTSVGKTTLMRTLLRRDVGTVDEGIHTTDESESFPMIRENGVELVLWDTPGLGATPDLIQMLGEDNRNLDTFLKRPFDKHNAKDRPFHCSREAIRNILNKADLVLYLVDISQKPNHAGYVKMELKLLSQLGKPALFLLNKVTPEDPRRGLSAWSRMAGKFELPDGRDLFPSDPVILDGHRRCWIQEHELLEGVTVSLPEKFRQPMEVATATWIRNNMKVMDLSASAMAEFMADAARKEVFVKGIPIGEQSGDLFEKMTKDIGVISEENREKIRKAAKKLNAQIVKKLGLQTGARKMKDMIEESMRELLKKLLENHGLDGEQTGELHEFLSTKSDWTGEWNMPSARRMILGGGTTGAAIDLMIGGSSVGLGLAIGATLGAVGYIISDGELTLKIDKKTMKNLIRQMLIHYMAIAHSGRGKGPMANVEFEAENQEWAGIVDNVLARNKHGLNNAIEALLLKNNRGSKQAKRQIQDWIKNQMQTILGEEYGKVGLFPDPRPAKQG